MRRMRVAQDSKLEIVIESADEDAPNVLLRQNQDLNLYS